MKRHLLGILITLVAFSLGLFASPIRFDCVGMGHGDVDDNGVGSYWIHSYKSMYFVSLSHEGENYRTSERARAVFEKRAAKPESEEIVEQSILEQTEDRIIISVQTKNNLQGYCVIKTEENNLHSICSSSLQHTLEFEKQNFNY